MKKHHQLIQQNGVFLELSFKMIIVSAYNAGRLFFKAMKI